MDDEEIEKQFAEDVHIQDCGFMNKLHYEEQRAHVIGGLIKYGDMWAMSLGYALNEANVYDSIKVMRYWRPLCEQHAIMYKMFLAKEKAENASD